jgi:F-type H+-transporting ATPase subunit b
VLAAPRLAEEATGIGALGIDPWSLLAYLVTFGLLVALLYTLAYKRILGVLDARSGRIRDSLEEADRVRQEAQEQQESMQRTLLEGREEGQRVLAEAREAAERYREQQATQARAEAAQLVERAREEIRQERDAALEQVRSEFAALAVTAAERIIHRSLDPDAHRDLIDEVLAEGDARSGRN